MHVIVWSPRRGRRPRVFHPSGTIRREREVGEDADRSEYSTCIKHSKMDLSQSACVPGLYIGSGSSTARMRSNSLSYSGTSFSLTAVRSWSIARLAGRAHEFGLEELRRRVGTLATREQDPEIPGFARLVVREGDVNGHGVKALERWCWHRDQSSCASLCSAPPVHCTVAELQLCKCSFARSVHYREPATLRMQYYAPIVPQTAVKMQSDAEKRYARKLGICTPFLARRLCVQVFA
ncbi:hypothetical protein DFH11DRAFT_713341 [Phellopilus nigrolimitatus]|nr:hypothetical protein DFH11DRAFT_713341 [Phellopilus nigrolimitatus]